MTRLFRLACVAVLVGMVLSLGLHGLGGTLSPAAGNVVLARQVPAGASPGLTFHQPVTASPVPIIQGFFNAVQNGDMDIVSTVTGGDGSALGIQQWCSKGLTAFVGHTTFGKWDYVIYHNDGQNMSVNVDGFMTFTDPGAFPNTRCITHYYIDGDFILKASGNNWVIVKLPNYQGAMCDGPNSWGADPHIFPWHGDEGK
jgi:hypothetical protein